MDAYEIILPLSQFQYSAEMVLFGNSHAMKLGYCNP